MVVTMRSIHDDVTMRSIHDDDNKRKTNNDDNDNDRNNERKTNNNDNILAYAFRPEVVTSKPVCSGGVLSEKAYHGAPYSPQ